MRARRLLLFSILSLAACAAAFATTTITVTRDEIAEMAGLWEIDSISISHLANSQYPAYASNWQYIYPHSGISTDGDIHIDMAVDSFATGSNGNNIGESPIVPEVINATSAQLSQLSSLLGREAIFRGIFRFYTEHIAERHFEIHPATELEVWDGSSFVTNTDYHPNIVAVPDGTTHTTTTLSNLLNGSETMSATIENDGIHVDLTLPSPSVNYVQYDGVTLSGMLTDAISSYFVFQPNLVPTATVRCRLVANSAVSAVAVGLAPNQSVTVNALTRTDVSEVSSQVSTMLAGQSKAFPRPVELIVLGLPAVGPTPTPAPTATPTPAPTVTPTPTPTATPLPTVATPSISPNGGTFKRSVRISLSCLTTGATIHYTTDGSDPTAASRTYFSPFSLKSSATVKAIATKSGYDNSAIATADFMKVRR